MTLYNDPYSSTLLFHVDSGGSLTLRRLTLTRGFSSGDGGAISNNGTMILENSTIHNSNAVGSGGAIVSYGPLTITGSTLSDNSAANAGAIYPRWSAATTMITNSSLRNNRTTSMVNGWGGAILLWDGANVTIEGGEIVGNSARLGGGIHNRFANSTVTLTSVRFIDNKAAVGSIVVDINGGGIYNSLGPLLNNGGPTMTHLPESGSPLIDGGQCIASITTDQRGVARPQGTACDIGAVEVRSGDHQKQVFLPFLRK